MQAALHAPTLEPCCHCAQGLWPIMTPDMSKSRLIGVVARLASTLGLPLTGLAYQRTAAREQGKPLT